MKILNAVFLLLLGVYVYAYFANYPAPLFSPLFAGNDARQQLFPLYTVINPDAFKGDLIYEAMRGYLAPLHLFISETITRFTQSPVMTGHWVMMLQLIPTVVFVYLAVRKLSEPLVACFSVAWIFNSPNLIRNFYGGLPRGWAGVVISSFLYFLLTKNHKAIIAVFFMGCMLHPHSAFLVIVTYSIYLGYNLVFSKDRDAILKPLIVFIIACPFIFGLTTYVVKRPPEIGNMVSLEEASKMPAFSADGGRFPFLPLDPPLKEIRKIGFKAFMEIEDNKKDVSKSVFYTIIGIYLAFLVLQVVTKRQYIPKEFLLFLAAIFTSYFLARFFAFKLYVPVRYLNWPLGLFFVITAPVMVWKLFVPDTKRRDFHITLGVIFLIYMAFNIYLLGGDGLGGRTNYKEGKAYDDPMYEWMREKLPLDAIIAGHPSHLDGVQLYAGRIGFVTSETAHPFYDKYNEEMERRLYLSFKTMFSRSREDFKNALNAEGIDYFVFGKSYFSRRKKDSEQLKPVKYYKPFDTYLNKLLANGDGKFLYFQFLEDPSLQQAVVYDSKDALIVDVSKL